jgi:ABC-2 type transport system permease protein
MYVFPVHIPDDDIGKLIAEMNAPIQRAINSLDFSCFLMIYLTALLFASGSISDEFEKKTGLLLYPTPQRRVSIFAGKYLAALAAVLLVVSMIYIVVTAQVIGLYGMGSIPVALGKSYLAAAFYSCSVVSIIYFFSSIFKKALVSAFTGLFLLFLVLPGLQILMNTLELNKENWFLLSSHVNLITAVLNESRVYPEGLFHSTVQVSFGTGIAVMIAYAIIFFAAGTWIANRKDMT